MANYVQIVGQRLIGYRVPCVTNADIHFQQTWIWGRIHYARIVWRAVVRWI